MSGENASQLCHSDEARDVHPILRANSFLIEEGLKLVRGEKYLSSEELKRIDLLFEDKDKNPTFVEVKWSDVSEVQMVEYRRLIDLYFPKSRLIWAVPQKRKKRGQIYFFLPAQVLIGQGGLGSRRRNA